MSDFEERARKAAEAVRREVDRAVPEEERPLGRAKRSQMRTVLPSSVAVIALVAAGLFFLPGNNGNGSKNGTLPPYALAGALLPFNECGDALQYFKDQAPKYFIERASGGRMYASDMSGRESGPTTTSANQPQSAIAGGSGTSDAAPPAAGTDYSTTNIQEQGVDEPDVIKTDGEVIVAVAQGAVQVMAVNGGQPQLKATLSESAATGVLLSGSKLLVLSGGNNGMVPMRGGISSSGQWYGSGSSMKLYNISDITKPELLGSMSVSGAIVDARLVGEQVRVATASSPDPNIPSPTYGPTGEIDQKSKDALPGQVAATTIDEWLPSYSITNGKGEKVSNGRLVQCDNLSRPTTFSGLDTVSVSAFNIDKAFTDFKSAGVIAGGSNVYATASNLYLTSTDWTKDGSVTHTNIHEFTTNENNSSSYIGSGVTDGSIINQYSMSEYKGVFRIATTLSGQRGWINPRMRSEGMVTTFKNEGKTLKKIGQVDGLGREDNESVTAVRFVGDKAYVSTARQTDPLFIIDLSQPEAPKVAGQLEIPGSSSYLHPLSNNLVFGVGQDGAQHLQFSLYDVSNAAEPKRVGILTYGWGQTPSANDAKAFLYWMPRNLVIAPANIYGAFPEANDTKTKGITTPGQDFSGLILMRADGTTLKEIGRLADVDINGGNVNRSIVIGDNVYLLSYNGLQVNSLDTHKNIASLKFNGGGSSYPYPVPMDEQASPPVTRVPVD